jgi:3-methyladenine DNA glycosylase AlkD
VWERRIALLATFYFIEQGKFADTLQLCVMLLRDDHDLIHKAAGWMLREIGKRDLRAEKGFLDKYYALMPRTMLRYAIERFPERARKRYMRPGPKSRFIKRVKEEA